MIVDGVEVKTIPGKFRKVQKRINNERVYVYEGLKIVPEAYKNFLGRP